MFRLIPLAALLGAPVAAAAPLTVTSEVLAERPVAAADGTTRTTLAPAARAVPGDRLTVVVRYRNTGVAPIANLAITNPVPAGLTYRGPAPGGRPPELSTDGVRFGSLGALSVAGRPATAADVIQVRWRLASPVAPGSGGQFAFQAVLK